MCIIHAVSAATFFSSKLNKTRFSFSKFISRLNHNLRESQEIFCKSFSRTVESDPSTSHCLKARSYFSLRKLQVSCIKGRSRAGGKDEATRNFGTRTQPPRKAGCILNLVPSLKKRSGMAAPAVWTIFFLSPLGEIQK